MKRSPSKTRKALSGQFTREDFLAAIWNWLDKYADRLEEELLWEDLHKARLERLANNEKQAATCGRGGTRGSK